MPQSTLDIVCGTGDPSAVPPPPSVCDYCEECVEGLEYLIQRCVSTEGPPFIHCNEEALCYHACFGTGPWEWSISGPATVETQIDSSKAIITLLPESHELSKFHTSYYRYGIKVSVRESDDELCDPIVNPARSFFGGDYFDVVKIGYNCDGEYIGAVASCSPTFDNPFGVCTYADGPDQIVDSTDLPATESSTCRTEFTGFTIGDEELHDIIGLDGPRGSSYNYVLSTVKHNPDTGEIGQLTCPSVCVDAADIILTVTDSLGIIVNIQIMEAPLMSQADYVASIQDEIRVR